VAEDKGVDPAALQPILEAIGAKDAPIAEIPARLRQFVDEARARAAAPVPRPNNAGADVADAIAASRERLSRLDTAGALEALRAKVAEEQRGGRGRAAWCCC